MHDPTTLNRQGYDIGEIYRSVILYHSPEQQAVAQDALTGFAADLWDDPIITQLVPFDNFWPATEDMQDFYNNNPSTGYCMASIYPKVIKLRKQFGAKLKPE